MTAVAVEVWRFRATKRPGTGVLVAREGALVCVDGNELTGLASGAATDLSPNVGLDVPDLQGWAMVIVGVGARVTVGIRWLGSEG